MKIAVEDNQYSQFVAAARSFGNDGPVFYYFTGGGTVFNTVAVVDDGKSAVTLTCSIGGQPSNFTSDFPTALAVNIAALTSFS